MYTDQLFQSVTPQKLDLIRMQLNEEIERTYHERFKNQEGEVEELRSTCNKLKHELFFLKSEYEHEQNESRQILGELKLQHDAEVGGNPALISLGYFYEVTSEIVNRLPLMCELKLGFKVHMHS